MSYKNYSALLERIKYQRQLATADVVETDETPTIDRVTAIKGTTNQVNASAPVGDVTLSLPQDIHPGASPQFAALTVSGNLQSGPATVLKDWPSSATTNIIASFTSYGDANRYLYQHANGTSASPTQTLSGDTIFNLQARSYHSGGAFATAARAAFSAEAQENHTATAQGTRIRFITTPSGSTAQAERMRITGEGLVGIINNAPSAYLDVVSNAAGTPSAEFQAASTEGGTASNVIFRDGSGAAVATVTANGAIQPASLTDANAPNNSIYYSTTQNKLCYKDAGSVVNVLY